MEIGGFWGMPAPMLIVACAKKDEILNYFKMLNTPMNLQILQDLQIELKVLQKIESLASFDFHQNEQQLFSTVYGNRCSVSNGEIVSTIGDPATLRYELLSEMVFKLAFKILKGEQSGKYVKLSKAENVKVSLITAINSFLETATFDAIKLDRKVIECYKGLLTKDGNKYSNEIVECFGVEKTVNETVIINGEQIALSKDAQNILKRYLTLIPTIKSCLNQITISTVKEVTIFDISFFELVKRKPASLLYVVINKFDYAKGRQNSVFLQNVITDVKNEIQKYKNCLLQFVEIHNKGGSVDVLTEAKYFELVQNFNPKKRYFFEELEETGTFCITDLLVTDFKVLSCLYDSISSLDIYGLNEYFQINRTSVTEWDKIISQLCQVGVCGLNYYSLELFAESIAKISLVSNNKLLKEQKDLDEIYRVLFDIDSLLDTLIPIGEVLL